MDKEGARRGNGMSLSRDSECDLALCSRVGDAEGAVLSGTGQAEKHTRHVWGHRTGNDGATLTGAEVVTGAEAGVGCVEGEGLTGTRGQLQDSHGAWGTAWGPWCCDNCVRCQVGTGLLGVVAS